MPAVMTKGGGADIGWMPPVEVFERDHRFTVRVELPGIKKEEIVVTYTDGVLTIEGERRLENETLAAPTKVEITGAEEKKTVKAA